MNEKRNVFIACPTHDGRLDFTTAKAMFNTATKKHGTIVVSNRSSLLTWNCNNLWYMALNAREKYHLTWFAMLHSDITPEDFWLDKMIEIAEEQGADLLSVVSPIKDGRRLTSTALSNKFNPDDITHITLDNINCPLSTRHDPNGNRPFVTQMPETFDVHDAVKALQYEAVEGEVRLLVNTGCMICRIDKPWAEKISFRMTDYFKNNNGLRSALIMSEDWHFSAYVHWEGGKVMATSAIRLKHTGIADFYNYTR
jgi:hypothetical protein